MTQKSFNKNEYIYSCGDTVNSVCLVQNGTCLLKYDDFWGNTNIITEITKGQIFAEAYACVPNKVIDFDVLASTDCDIYFFDIKKLFTTCSSGCEYHSKIIQNLLSAVAVKNIILNDKLRCITMRSTREKILSYLSSQAKKNGSSDYLIPFNRQQMADYLSVERSAMSKELSKMQKEGILSYNKNRFCLKENN